jgi:hypothetical protein
MFHGHRWMKCYPGTSPIAITECCDLVTDVPWASMNEVLPRDQCYGHFWMLRLEDRCSMGIDEWSASQGPVQWPLLNVVTWEQMFHGHRWMKYYSKNSPMAITECGDLKTDVPGMHKRHFPFCLFMSLDAVQFSHQEDTFIVRMTSALWWHQWFISRICTCFEAICDYIMQLLVLISILFPSRRSQSYLVKSKPLNQLNLRQINFQN